MKKIVCCGLLWILILGCREKYTSPYISPPTGYLVIEGIINSGIGPTNLSLSRTTITNDQDVSYETGDIVQVEGNDNTIYGLTDMGNGTYNSNQLNLNSAQQYRLRIKTRDGKEYLSDFVAAKSTPPIDSIYWREENGGVQIYGHSHDPLNNTHYYQWNAEETWEFHTPYVATLRYDPPGLIFPYYPKRVEPITPDLTRTICWNSSVPNLILIGSSAKLSQDVIDSFAVVFVPPGSVKLSVEYSILVKQYAMTPEAYLFLEEMKKNTEETGSIFDAQPSQLNGNIHCTTNSKEPVIGFISVCSEQTKRIFISRSQLSSWGYDQGCFEKSVANYPDSLAVLVAAGDGFIPIIAEAVNPVTDSITSFLAAPNFCVDCTLSGTNKKPSYWP